MFGDEHHRAVKFLNWELQMSAISKIAFCPHCGNQTPQKLVHVQTCGWTGSSLVNDEELDLGRTYFVASCETCKHILLYSMWGDDHDEKSHAEIFAESYLEYPDSSHLYLPIPELIKQIYEEASKLKPTFPDHFAVQIRKALEALCEDRGAKGKNLQQQINYMVSNEELPATLADAADILRLLGNVGAHASGKHITFGQADAIDKFFLAIVEYIYVAPSRVNALRDSWLRSKSQEDTSGNA